MSRSLKKRLSQKDFLGMDLLVTLCLCIFWLWFGYQYGFNNSPDSWYRGVLGKSILEGHPYFINLKQGWLYEFGAFHHDATHEPLLPFLYALFFWVFGNKIIIANMISCLSAALLIFPLLRLSRVLFDAAPPAVFLYLFTVINRKSAYLFEVTAGLSIPTLLLLLACLFLFLVKLLESNRKIYFWGAVISAVFYYHVRSAAQLIFFWMMFWSLFLAYRIFDRSAVRRLGKMWLVGLLLVLPWMLRKVVLFGSPFFSHITPMLWTDRGYDLWTFHEKIPLPTAAAYFETHSLTDFIKKITVDGTVNFYTVFDRVTWGPFWIYLVLFIVSAVFIWRSFDPKRRFFFAVLWLVLIGYLGIYSLVPILEVRYMIPVYFILVLTLVAAFFMFCRKHFQRPETKLNRGWIYTLALLLLAGANLVGTNLIGKNGQLSKGAYFPLSYHYADKILQEDLLVQALLHLKKEKAITVEDVILGPFAEVQRLSFSTGLTYIERPDNLQYLDDPVGFFQKYRIRYALVDVSRVLPEGMIADVQMAGDKPLFQIAAGHGKEKKPAPPPGLLEEPKISASIMAGVKSKTLYIDGYHGGVPQDLSVLDEMGLRPYVYRSDVAANQDSLFQSGLLLIHYAMHKNELSDEDFAVVKRFIANGGRVLLLCPVWVWTSYEKKGIQRLPFYKIARQYNAIMTAEYVGGPLKFTSHGLGLKASDPWFPGVFSHIIYRDGIPIMEGSRGQTAAVALERGKSRAVVWGQNNLLTRDVLGDSHGKKLVTNIFAWLLDDQ